MITVVHLNTWDIKGGAARAVSRLHQGLRALGYDSRMLVGFAQGEEGARLQTVQHGWPTWKRALHHATLGAEKLSGLQYLLLKGWTEEVTRHPFLQQADLVHLHNLHGGYVSHTMLPALSRRVPVVWTLHDLWPLTGHCAFSLECERWQTGCGHCPLLSDYPELMIDTTALLWRVKRQVYKRARLTIVAPSTWIAEQVQRSPLLGHCSIHHVPYGIDTTVFHPQPMATARATLQLPANDRIVLCVASDLAEERKGFRYLQQALGRVSTNGNAVRLVVVGRHCNSLPASIGNIPLQAVGNVESDQRLALYYAAADLTVLPTLADNLPQTVMESMACATPVVAFNVGGVPDLITHLESGYLAILRDEQDLARGIERLLHDTPMRLRIGQRARQVIERDFPLELERQRIAALYEDVLARHREARQRISPPHEDVAAPQFAAATRIGPDG